jgi:hypothetical protein
METDLDLCKDILAFGIKPTERLLHFGCGDKQTNFLNNVIKLNPQIFYLGVDVNIDTIDSLNEKYKDNPEYAFQHDTMQNFLDYTMFGREGSLEFENILISGIFDKPAYKEKQHIFISTVVKRCLQFTNSVIFTVDDYNYREYNYTVLYVINNLISSFNNIQMKKKFNKYIFCVTN